jgi:ankyrin repeat protein
MARFTASDQLLAHKLIDYGADVNKKGESGLTPLHFAASCEKVELFNLLVSKGADIHASGVGGRTPIHFAASNGCIKIIDIPTKSGG